MQHRPEVLSKSSVHFIKSTDQSRCSPELEVLSRLMALHRGEMEALQEAQDHPGCILLTDDTAARIAAKHMRVMVHGTIGVLIRAIRRKQRAKSEVLNILRSLPEVSTLHIRRSLLDEIISQVEASG